MKSVNRAGKSGSEYQTTPLNSIERVFMLGDRLYGAAVLHIAGCYRFPGAAPTLTEFREKLQPRLADEPILCSVESETRPRCWEQRSTVVLAEHVREWRCPAGTGLSLAAEQIMATPLSRNRPLWEIWLVHGTSIDGWYAILKAHHAFLDGASLITLAERLLPPVPVPPPASPVVELPTPVGPTAQMALAKGIIRYAGRFLPPARFAFTRPPRNGKRRFAWAFVSRELVHDAARHHGVTVNDIFLAALATALREWTGTPWRNGRPRRVWTLVPVDLRRREGGKLIGNKVTNIRVPLPCDDPDPIRRLRVIAAHTHSAESCDQIAIGGAAQRSIPVWLVGLAAAMTFSRWHISMTSSNVRGSDQPTRFDGRPSSDPIALGLLPPRHPLGAFLVNNHDQIGISIVTDAAAPYGQGLADLWIRAVTGLGELRAVEERPVAGCSIDRTERIAAAVPALDKE